MSSSQPSKPTDSAASDGLRHCDVFIVGGGINGAGIARDAAGRGYRVSLCDSGDFGSGTSSASTKLIHGGLRYLEHYKFRLVAESLRERERLLQAAPHIIRPMRFLLPHHKALRPRWMLRLGLFIYDHLGGRKLLPKARRVDLRLDPAGQVLQPRFDTGFEYSDCWVEDSRLVVLNLRDACHRGANVMPRTKLINARYVQGQWRLILENQITGEEYGLSASILVNAAGPWVDEVLRTALGHNDTDNIRLVGGSHIVIKRQLPDGRAYMFQNADGRVVFAIPYEEEYLLIGTTDNDHASLEETPKISEEEIQYLCDVASQYLAETVTPEDVVWHFSGVRPLFNDGASEATEATRDYVITQDRQYDDTLINVFGGKITTYRKMAEGVLALVDQRTQNRSKRWTAGTALPGGDFAVLSFETLVIEAQRHFAFADPLLVRRLAHLYGTEVWALLKDCKQICDLGTHFGAGLYQVEVDYLVREEWARLAQDIIYRRTKLGLRMTTEEISALEQYLDTLHFLQDASVDQRVSDLSPDVDSAQTAEAVGHLLS